MFVRIVSSTFTLWFLTLSGFPQTTRECDTLVQIHINHCIQGETLPFQLEHYYGNSKKIQTRMVFLDHKGRVNSQTYYENQLLKESVNYGSASKGVKETVQWFDDPPFTLYIYKPKRLGDYRTWYENGNLNTHGRYEQDKPSGIWRHYYPNGFREREGNYQGSHNRRFIKTGSWTLYYDNGNFKEKVSFENNLRTGACEEFHDNGNLKGKGTYRVIEGTVPDTILVTSPTTLEETWEFTEAIGKISVKADGWEYWDAYGTPIPSEKRAPSRKSKD